ncbi:MAG: methyl-accepting chemotaxis protein [Planctomycetota bacterium]
MRWTIQLRLILGFGILLLLCLASGGVALFGKSRITASADALGEMAVDLATGSDTAVSMLMARMHVKDFLINNEPEDIEKFNATSATLLKSIAESKASFQNPERAAAIRQIEEEYAIYDTTFDRVEQIIFERNELIENMYDSAKSSRQSLTKAIEVAAANGDPEVTALAANAAQSLLLARVYANHYIRSHTDEDIASFNKWADTLQAALDDVPSDSPVAEHFAAASADFDNYLAKFSSVRDLIAQRDELVHETLDKLGPNIAGLTNDIKDSLITDVGQNIENIADARSEVTLILLAVIGLCFVIGVATAYLLSTAITKPINAVVARLREIANGDGDLTVRLRERGTDEFSELGKSFNTFVKKIAEVVDSVKEIGEGVASQSEVVAQTSGEIATRLGEQEEQATNVSVAMEQMNQTVTDIARNSADAAQSGETNRTAVEEGVGAVTSTVNEVEAIAMEVRNSAASVTELGRKSEQIGEIIAVINDIADQTNLLALNAAIEAARAGEHGRGFAVVADEVRKLAERTTTATEQVTASIQEIQGGTSTAVDTINASTARAEKGVELASAAGQTFESIRSSNDGLQTMVAGIAAATEQQSATSVHIAESILKISNLTQDSASGARTANEAAQDLNAKALKLRESVARFTTDRNSVAKRVDEGGKWVAVSPDDPRYPRD